jgi:CHAD domain-containing protein
VLSNAMTIAEGLRLAAVRPLQQLEENLGKIAATDGVEAVHDARVALRRLGALLRASRPFVAEAALSKIRAEMRWLRRSLGAVRDLDVFAVDVFPPLREAMPDEAALDAIAAAAARRREMEIAALIEVAGSERCRRLVADLAAFFAGAADEDSRAPLDGFATKLLRQRFRKLSKAAEKVAELDDASLHRLRIRLRTLRYLSDSFASVLPARRYANFRRAAIELQDHLGALNDTVSAPRLAEKLAGDAEASPTLSRAAGLVAGWGAARREALRALLKRPAREFVARGQRLFDAAGR